MFELFVHPDAWRHLQGDATPPLTAEVYARDQAEAHLTLTGTGASLLGRCSLWWSAAPALEGRRVGAIGHYAAANINAGAQLLVEACARLRAVGCEVAVGPMDGNTWRSYRLILERGSEPPFILEPEHPDECAAHWRAAGFDLLAGYRSSMCDDLTLSDPRLERVQDRLSSRGVRLRALARDRLDAEMQAIYAVSIDAFRAAMLYQPVSLDAFRRLYLPVLSRVDPALVLLAEREGEAVGFAFAMPDHLQATRGQSIDTAIVKTLAVRADRRLGGLGGLLLQRCHLAARQLGMRRVIHALMHERNHTMLALSSRYARPIRRYGLFARELR